MGGFTIMLLRNSNGIDHLWPVECFSHLCHNNSTEQHKDGYRFGNADVYCPWDVVNYCKDHRESQNAAPKNYWMNTSGNDVINHFTSMDYFGFKAI